MTIGRRSTDQGSGGTDWLPCPQGVYRFNVGAGKVKLSRFKNEKTGGDQYNVSFPMSLTDEEYERAKGDYDGEIGEDETLSGRCWYTCGLTLGWFKRGEYQSTRLADFLVTLLGNKQQSGLRKYLVDGGGPFISADGTADEEIAEWDTWFQWFEGAQVYGTVTHRLDKAVPGKVWADFGGPIPVGSLPGQPDPDYQAFGRGKLRMIVNQDSGAPAPVDGPKYDATGEPIQAAPAPVDTAAMLAELEELRKLKAAQNQATVAAVTGGVSEETYNAVFGDKVPATA